MRDFVENTIALLGQRYLRSNSGAGFVADKKMLGWGVARRKGDRIDGALTSIGIWHNIFQIAK